MSNQLSSRSDVRISANSAPNCLQSATPADALGDAQALAAFLRRVAEWQARDDDPLTSQEICGLQLCHALLSDKLEQAAGDSEMPLVSFTDKKAPSLGSLLRAGAWKLEELLEGDAHE